MQSHVVIFIASDGDVLQVTFIAAVIHICPAEIDALLTIHTLCVSVSRTSAMTQPR